jgi:hypothetical protein
MSKPTYSSQGQLVFETSSSTPAAKRVDRGVLPAASKSTEAEAAPRAFADGQRVRVKIRGVRQFSGDAGERMNGRLGAVSDYSAKNFNGDPPLGPAYLVQFDEPIAGWHAHQSDVTAFWFPPGDLEDAS